MFNGICSVVSFDVFCHAETWGRGIQVHGCLRENYRGHSGLNCLTAGAAEVCRSWGSICIVTATDKFSNSILNTLAYPILVMSRYVLLLSEADHVSSFVL